MNEEDARAAAEAVVRGEHPNQERGDAKIARDIERLRRLLREVFTNKETDDSED